ncbi:inovirus Gp2 family protein [Vibrio fortis]|uniref:inovirus Gp2 family protein n=1 Tax=Vibrio fortis TaxID=212667 RepID=UPI003EBEE841
MYKRLFTNTNLSLFESDKYKSIPVLTTCGPFAKQYLERTKSVFDKTLKEYPRVYVLRFDLRFPQRYFTFYSDHISKFIESLKSKIDADLNRKNKKGMCNLRFVWAKEQDTSDNPHYHVAIFLNKDVYFTHGYLSAHDGNLSAMIKQAWASSLGLLFHELNGCVHFPRDCGYWIDKNGILFKEQYNACFLRLSYLAKVETKIFQKGLKNFGSSRK